MIDKGKLKTFLKSNNFITRTKLLVLDILKGLRDNPIDNAYLITYICDLDIFEDGFLKLPNSYHLIDFTYLEQLNSKLQKYYINLIYDGIAGDNKFNISFTVMNTTFLVEHGILISNIEHLKMKRKEKLEEVEARESLSDAKIFGGKGGGIDDSDDFFNLDDF